MFGLRLQQLSETRWLAGLICLNTDCGARVRFVALTTNVPIKRKRASGSPRRLCNGVEIEPDIRFMI